MGTKESPVIGDTPALNQSTIVGQLVAIPDRRTLPSGSVAASFSLTVRVAGAKTTSVPIVWYDPPKRIDTWVDDDLVVVRGAVVRRFFQSAGGLGSSTEVVVDEAELWRHRAKAQRLFDACASSLRSVVTASDGPAQR